MREDIKRFDLVMIKTVKNVKWLSGPAGRPATPNGTWSVVAGVDDNHVIISKNETLAQIPLTDLQKVFDYDVSHAINGIREISELPKEKKDEKRQGRS